MDDLAHHGILGQKWGIRRFQSEDGSLTNAGKKRYGGEGFVSRTTPKIPNGVLSDGTSTVHKTKVPENVLYSKKQQKLADKLKKETDYAKLNAKDYRKNVETYKKELEDLEKNRGNSKQVDKYFKSFDDDAYLDLIAQDEGWNGKDRRERDKYARENLAKELIKENKYWTDMDIKSAKTAERRYAELKTIDVSQATTRKGRKEVERLIKQAGYHI